MLPRSENRDQPIVMLYVIHVYGRKPESVLSQVKLVRLRAFCLAHRSLGDDGVARVQLLPENAQIIRNDDKFVDECLERHFFRLRYFMASATESPVGRASDNG